MIKRIRSIFKNNKTTIIVSTISSVLTILIFAIVLIILLATKTISLNNSLLSTSQPTGPVQVNSTAEESNVINVVAKANPAVVSIIITKDVPVFEQYYQQFNLFGNLNIPQQNQGDTQQQEIGGGSGFFVTSDGYIVTNSHVVEDSTANYTVITSNGKKHDAKILAKDSTLDVAIIKIDGNNYNYLTFGNSDEIRLGQSAIAIGNALAQYQNSISMGIISGLSRSIVAGDSSTGSSEQLDGVIQTDAAINPGNSGGPLLDIKGNVIGVNVAVENDAENISFALPGNMVKGIVDSVKKNGEIVKPYLGVRYTQVTDSVKKANNLSVDYGVIISRGSTVDELAVIPGSPADKAGLVENDIILEIDGVKLDSSKSLVSIIRQKQVGQAIKLKIMHDGKEKEISVKLEKSPSNS